MSFDGIINTFQISHGLVQVLQKILEKLLRTVDLRTGQRYRKNSIKHSPGKAGV
jgi:hypothetical protein